MSNVIIKEVLEYLDSINESYDFLGNREDCIEGFSSFKNYKANTITWLRNLEKNNLINLNNIRRVVIPAANFGKDYTGNCIIVENPHRIFFNILSHFYDTKKSISRGENNIISPTAKIAKSVTIGNNCIIEDNVEIGENTVIYDGVIISRNVKIGNRCSIKSGAVIGQEGYGHSKNEMNEYSRVPHLGSVVIGNCVDVGANTCIDRGTIDNTVIGNGVKIDNLCQIGHEVQIKENTLIAGKTIIGGSTIIGRNVWLGIGTTISNGIRIGNNAYVCLGSVVVSNVKENEKVAGNFAISSKKFFKHIKMMELS